MKLVFNKKQLTIPENVNILGFNHKIVPYKNNYETQDSINMRNGNATLFGAVHYAKQEISLNNDPSINDEKKMDTLIHECVHAVDNIMGLGFSEETVQKLGKGLSTVFRDLMQHVEDIPKEEPKKRKASKTKMLEENIVKAE